MNQSKKHVVVTQRFFDDQAIAYLKDRGCTVGLPQLPIDEADGNLAPASLLGMLQRADGWIVGHARVTRDLLVDLPKLQIVSRRGVGYERVDVEAVRELGRILTITAGGNDASVADHTIGLMLAVARRLRESQNQMLAGNWSILTSTDLFQKTVGIIGLGRIGKSLVKRLSGFEARILVHHPRPDEEYGRNNNISYVDVDTLLRQSDYVTLHAPLTPQTRFLIDRERLARMKSTAILINTARGGLVEDADLLNALKSGTIAGAGLDVFISERDPTFKAISSELIALPNVIATPHAAASSREGLARANMIAAQSVVAVLNGQSPPPACIVTDGRSR